MGSRISNLWACRRGGVATPFALLLLPLSLMLFGAIDYNKASETRAALQDALDAATLAVGRSTADSDAEVQAVGENVLKANLKAQGSVELTGSSFHLAQGHITGSATAKVQTVAADLVMASDLTVRAQSEAVRATHKMEIALVLDNTGSMAGTKLTTLKSAAKAFIDEMEQAAARADQPGSVKIAVAPFSMTVNVGPEQKTADWMDGHLDISGNPTTPSSPIRNEIFTTASNRFALLKAMNVAWGGCVESRPAPYDVQDTAPSSGTPATLFVPFFAPDEPDTTNAGFYNNYLTDTAGTSGWQQRQGNPAKYNKAPKTGTTSIGYAYGPNSGCALAPVMRLSTTFGALRTRIDAMTAVGDTNIPLGLVWGWHLIAPSAPFGDGSAYATEGVEKVVILMTDGQNANADASSSNDSYYSGIGYIWQNRLGITSGTATQRRTAIDNRLTLLCQNMKAKGVTLYTVRVEVNDGENAVLKACATSENKFYDVQNVSELTQVFKAIAGSIQNLHLVR